MLSVSNFSTHRSLGASFGEGLRALADLPTKLKMWISAVTLISFGTTAYGLMLLYGESHGAAWLGIVLPIAVAGILHAIILTILAHAAAKRSVAAFLCALSLQGAPAALSTATHWFHLNGHLGYAQSAATGASAVRIAIGMRATAERAMLARLEDLRDYSRERADIEAREGNTCGAASGVGASYRAALRRSDATEFAAMWDGAKARHDRVSRHQQMAAELAFGGSKDDIAASVTRLTSIVEAMRGEVEANPEYRIVAAQLRSRLGQRDFMIPDRFRRPGGPTTFQCPDQRLERGIDAALAAAAAIPQVPDVAVIDTTDPKVALDQALNRIARKLAGGLDAAPLTAGDKAALALAFAIEALLTLAFAVHAVVGPNCKPPSGPAMRHRIALAAEDASYGTSEIAVIYGAARASVGSPLKALAPWIVWRRSGLEIAIPTADIAAPETEAALLFCQSLIKIGIAVPIQGFLRSARTRRRYFIGEHQLTEFLGNCIGQAPDATPPSVVVPLKRVA